MGNTPLDHYLDLAGQRFGRLVVVKMVDAKTKHGRPNSQSTWLCKCDCGGSRVAVATILVHGKAPSCGCMKREASVRLWERRRANILSHDLKGSSNTKHWPPEYRAWINIKQRCYNLQHAAYKNYGGRGIEVCVHWRKDYKQFLADVGPKSSPELSIDRKDNELGYSCPRCLPPNGNCKWSTREEQTKNRRPVPTENLGKHMAVVWANRDGAYRRKFSEKMKAVASTLSPEARERRRQGGIKGGRIGGPIGSRKRWDKVAEQKSRP
jgi:hypothetical protein